MQQVGSEEAADTFDNLAGNSIRMAATLNQQLMSNEDERDFVNEKEKQLETLQKIVALCDETLESLRLVVKVQTTKKTLVSANRDLSICISVTGLQPPLGPS